MEARNRFIYYLNAKKVGVRTIQNYMRYWKLFNKEVDDTSPESINKFLNNHGNHPTPRAFLKNLSEFLDDPTLLPPKITGRKKRVKRKQLTIETYIELRKYIKENYDYVFVLYLDLAYWCGLRREETISIRVGDFEMNRWIHDKDKGGLLKIKGKGSKDRYVVVPPPVMSYVLRYIRKKQIDKPHFKLCITKAESYGSWHSKFKKAVKSLEGYNYSLHDLRRGCATRWNNENIPLESIKTRLGHSSITTTMLYINPDEERKLLEWASEY